ncbi:hypothetical protein DPMN_005972 [Dreissena polymorpha]|uniref:Uncharacterized protein n=1 Tax=Dreissena polymorpha TaxID=45954 RepID=A0A9D4RX29_DREPO|nr:hypothetical protein DPMN_005972 [Dreissena polymorpha]
MPTTFCQPQVCVSRRDLSITIKTRVRHWTCTDIKTLSMPGIVVKSRITSRKVAKSGQTVKMTLTMVPTVTIISGLLSIRSKTMIMTVTMTVTIIPTLTMTLTMAFTTVTTVAMTVTLTVTMTVTITVTIVLCLASVTVIMTVTVVPLKLYQYILEASETLTMYVSHQTETITMCEECQTETMTVTLTETKALVCSWSDDDTGTSA